MDCCEKSVAISNPVQTSCGVIEKDLMNYMLVESK